jgi:hypothetical protein
MRVTPCPSPTGRNDERLYIVRAPYGTPAGALDAALKRAKDVKGARDDDPSQVNLGELRQKLEYFLGQLPDSYRGAAMDWLDEHLPLEQREPAGKVYGTEDADDPNAVAESLWSKQPDHAQDDREKMRSFMEGKGCSDEEIESVLEKMPRSAIEDRRGGRDRKRGAMDRQHMAADSFAAMFPGSVRIKHGPF